ncbi:hypothetical protein B932_3767 (plasmid) [Gluconobacter oxydans H24]|nr:hypothetical protein B932_3767 [Gluconobacter oxydans H24]
MPHVVTSTVGVTVFVGTTRGGGAQQAVSDLQQFSDMGDSFSGSPYNL